MNTSNKTNRASSCKQTGNPENGGHIRKQKRRLAIIELAREQREQEGAVEIDDNAILSEGTDNGCYVQAWVWADFSDTKLDKDRNRGCPRNKQPSTNKVA